MKLGWTAVAGNFAVAAAVFLQYCELAPWLSLQPLQVISCWRWQLARQPPRPTQPLLLHRFRLVIVRGDDAVLAAEAVVDVQGPFFFVDVAVVAPFSAAVADDRKAFVDWEAETPLGCDPALVALVVYSGGVGYC